MTAKFVTLPAIFSLTPQGTLQAMVYMPASDLVRMHRLDRYTEDGGGYQRNLDMRGARLLKEFYLQGGMHTCISANIRDISQIAYDDPPRAGAREWSGTIMLPTETLIHITDGQHRIAGMGLAHEQDPFFNPSVPVLLRLGLTREEEALQFYYENGPKTSMPATLMYEAKAFALRTDPTIVAHLKRADQLIGATDPLLRRLEEVCPVWNGVFKSPNERANGRKCLPKAGISKTLLKVLSVPELKRLSVDDTARILDAYWRGIAKVLPEPFAEDTTPQAWSIQKTGGAGAMHHVFHQVFAVVVQRGWNVTDPDAYAKVLEPLKSLPRGSEFWRAGRGGGQAAKFHGDQHHRALNHLVESVLPVPTLAAA